MGRMKMKYTVMFGVRYRLKDMRESFKLTRKELVKLSGVGDYKIKLIENGSRNVSLSDLEKISQVFKSIEEKLIKDINSFL